MAKGKGKSDADDSLDAWLAEEPKPAATAAPDEKPKAKSWEISLDDLNEADDTHSLDLGNIGAAPGAKKAAKMAGAAPAASGAEDDWTKDLDFGTDDTATFATPAAAPAKKPALAGQVSPVKPFAYEVSQPSAAGTPVDLPSQTLDEPPLEGGAGGKAKRVKAAKPPKAPKAAPKAASNGAKKKPVGLLLGLGVLVLGGIAGALFMHFNEGGETAGTDETPPLSAPRRPKPGAGAKPPTTAKPALKPMSGAKLPAAAAKPAPAGAGGKATPSGAAGAVTTERLRELWRNGADAQHRDDFEAARRLWQEGLRLASSDKAFAASAKGFRGSLDNLDREHPKKQ